MLLQGRQTGFEERDLIPQEIFDETPDGDAVREQYGIERGTFAVILIGKDGGEKFRSEEPVGPKVFFDRIDAMPMRRREMRRGNTR